MSEKVDSCLDIELPAKNCFEYDTNQRIERQLF